LPGGRTAQVGVAAEGADANTVELGVRPEHLTVVDPQDATASFSGVVSIIEHLGNSTILYVDTPAGQLIVEGKGNLEARAGEAVGLRLSEPHAHLFGATGATL
jgi:ABC-type sugar transport system ATPase subunit